MSHTIPSYRLWGRAWPVLADIIVCCRREKDEGANVSNSKAKRDVVPGILSGKKKNGKMILLTSKIYFLGEGKQ